MNALDQISEKDREEIVEDVKRALIILAENRQVLNNELPPQRLKWFRERAEQICEAVAYNYLSALRVEAFIKRGVIVHMDKPSNLQVKVLDFDTEGVTDLELEAADVACGRSLGLESRKKESRTVFRWSDMESVSGFFIGEDRKLNQGD